MAAGLRKAAPVRVRIVFSPLPRPPRGLLPCPRGARSPGAPGVKSLGTPGAGSHSRIPAPARNERIPCTVLSP